MPNWWLLIGLAYLARTVSEHMLSDCITYRLLSLAKGCGYLRFQILSRLYGGNFRCKWNGSLPGLSARLPVRHAVFSAGAVLIPNPLTIKRQKTTNHIVLGIKQSHATPLFSTLLQHNTERDAFRCPKYIIELQINYNLADPRITTTKVKTRRRLSPQTE